MVDSFENFRLQNVILVSKVITYKVCTLYYQPLTKS